MRIVVKEKRDVEVVVEDKTLLQYTLDIINYEYKLHCLVLREEGGRQVIKAEDEDYHSGRPYETYVRDATEEDIFIFRVKEFLCGLKEKR